MSDGLLTAAEIATELRFVAESVDKRDEQWSHALAALLHSIAEDVETL